MWVPEMPRAALRELGHARFAAVIGADHEFEIVIQVFELIVQVGDVGCGRSGRIETLIETVVDPQSVATAGGRHELQRPRCAARRHRMDLAARFLGQDAEQDRLGQAGLGIGRPHLVAHVLIILVGVEQLWAHPGQPFTQRRAQGLVDLDQIAQLLAVQQIDAALALGQSREQR